MYEYMRERENGRNVGRAEGRIQGYIQIHENKLIAGRIKPEEYFSWFPPTFCLP